MGLDGVTRRRVECEVRMAESVAVAKGAVP